MAPARARSATAFVVPITVVAVVLAQTVLVSMWLGGHAEKWDAAADTVKEIKAEQYTQSDAAKDRQVINLQIADLTRRVEVLETARQHQVSVVQARQEKQEEDFLTRAGRWLSGGSK